MGEKWAFKKGSLVPVFYLTEYRRREISDEVRYEILVELLGAVFRSLIPISGEVAN